MNHPLITQFKQAGQGQVFKFWDALSPEEQTALLDDAAEIDLA